ncbi:hypothetical protein CDO52_11215 [Nocardiopsis gilva YIM 90087]|uniref:Uncharacterized protein n=1 Tax=Nocardiopsis gilva YIM 90087 TaxID=1235441 RepID=A0A223S558_9ACTN|nr:hypothetical protein [Nocardiopsis gilva]ASU83272.1 hypothetical protein CDO52_11215 [Nocardiopsis gilva YIM 90087]
MLHPDHAAELARQRQEEARTDAEQRRMLRDAKRQRKDDEDPEDDTPTAAFRPVTAEPRDRNVGPAA